MTVFLLIVFGFYFLFLFLVMYGWERALAQEVPPSAYFHSIAVIIPVRNEEANIQRLMGSLQSLHYPKEKLEMILVNDHSTDNTRLLLSEWVSPQIKIINLEKDVFGKKPAITRGVESTVAEIIVTTDADCIYHPDWLQSVNLFFSNRQVQMAVGPVAIDQKKSKSFFATLQAIEFSSLIGSGASLLQFGIPAMANGANLAFRREAFVSVKGYEGNLHIASGDDEYLMRKIFQAFPAGVVFNNRTEAVTGTLPQPDLSAFFHQRFRWAGKWKRQTSQKVKWIAVLVFLFQLSFLLSMYLALGHNLLLARVLLLAKAGLEGIFLWRVCQFLGVRFSLLPFALLQFVYPVYVVFTAIASLFFGFDWKGRKSRI